MPRILHLIASDSVGTAEKQLLYHGRDTRDAGYEIILGSFQDGSVLPEILTCASRLGVETVSVPGGIRPGLVDDLTGYLRTASIDLICTHGYKANAVGHFAARHANVPWVPFVRDFTAETWQTTLYERLEHSLVVRSPWVVCNSSTQARELGRLRRGRNAPLIIQNAVLAPKDSAYLQSLQAREEIGLREDTFMFGSTGRLGREEGHRTLLEAFSLLVRMMPDSLFHLLLPGSGRGEKALRLYARRLGIESRVYFAGPQAKTSSWMKVMDCLVHPSVTDGIPSSILEAMLVGTPVIAVAAGDVPDAIKNGQTGLLVRPDSPVVMAEAMKKMAESVSLRTRMAAEARRQVQRNFSPARQRELLELLYKTVLGNSFSAEAEELAHGVA